jgi:lipoate-protein ligase B
MRRKGFAVHAGIREYNEILNLQRRVHSARLKNTIPDIVFFLEHYPCITIGAEGKRDHILAGTDLLNGKGIKVYETDRGGDVTYHGPGQLVCYPIIDLRNYGRDVLAYARALEEMVIRTIQSFGIASGRKKNQPGVWVDGNRKIAAQGISVGGWVTMHGISLNVSPMMEHFSMIIPCGLKDCHVASMEECLGQAIDMTMVTSEMSRNFTKLFDIDLEKTGKEGIPCMLDYA